MVRLSTIRKVRVAQFAFLWVVFSSLHLCLAQRDSEEPNVLPLSTAYVPAPGYTMGETFYTTVQWDGQEYHAVEGTTVLMNVIVDPGTDATIRTKALQRLQRLRNRTITAQLITLYGKFSERDEKLGVIRCLIASGDPRGFPLFARVLEHEEDEMVRLSAAVAFAQWNVRRGVAELIRIHDTCKDATSAHSYVCNEAANSFARLNRHRGWGFADQRVREALLGRTHVNDDQRRELYLNEIKNWWCQNERRFPDWKPGDALPTAPELPPIPPGPEDVLSLSAARRTASPGAYWSRHGVSWKGERYPAAEAVDVLMKVALEPGSVVDRFFAIERLGIVGSQLRDTERIPQLMKLYRRLTDRSEKVAVLFCLAESKDQRALPLFRGIIDTQHEDYLRLPAAYGLALWNTRCGVRELITLLSVKQPESPILYPGIIRDEAARLLYRLNYWKSWWAPEAPLLAATGAGPEVRDELLDSCHAELKKWFGENEHRFPDWKLGDPLPEIRSDKDKEAGED